MKNNKVSLLLIITGAFLFNSIFWNEQLGINTVLFDAFILGSIFFFYPAAWKNNTVRYLLLAHLICLCTVIVFNSLLSKMAFSLTLLLLIAFAEYAHRSAWLAGGSLLVGFMQVGRLLKLLQRPKNNTPKKSGIGRAIRFAILPLFTGIVFFIIYCFANTVFASMASNMGYQIGKFFSSFFDLFSFARLLFLLLGFYLTGVLLLRASYTDFEKQDALATDNLPRTRKKRMDINRNLWYDITVGIMGKLAKGILALKNEYRTGLISLVMLNSLLLVINIIDIDYLWIHFNYTPAIDLCTMIHEGTELLILSIVLAMLVLLIFFRGNLNFYKKNKWLKIGAYVWLVQNTVLVISVLLRDYYYIREFGLAYKRIGVLVFLLLVIGGLITVFLKIRYAKTNYYLWRVNAWCAVVLLVLGSAVQWDVLIAKYNIAHRQTAPLDLPFLLTLSDKVLPVLDANMPALLQREKELKAANVSLGDRRGDLQTIMDDRLKNYKEEQQHLSWLSWNLTDANEKEYFLRKPSVVAVR